MKEQFVNPDFVADWEDVVRLLFSPLYISEGVLSQRAFMLEEMKRVKGGMPQTPARMLARMSLVNLAQKGIHPFSNS